MKLADLNLNDSYTYADYLTWSYTETVELIKGKIFKMSPAPSAYHQAISTKLLSRVEYFLGNTSCQVFHAPFDVRLPLPTHQKKDEEITTVVQPDLSVICDPKKIDARGCLGPPDWIIEILSPSTAHKDMKEKFEVYEKAGVKEYWIVFPVEKNILVYTLNEEGKYIGLSPFVRDDTISPVLFPNLKINLTDVFPDLDLAEESWEENYVRL